MTTSPCHEIIQGAAKQQQDPEVHFPNERTFRKNRLRDILREAPASSHINPRVGSSEDVKGCPTVTHETGTDPAGDLNTGTARKTTPITCLILTRRSQTASLHPPGNPNLLPQTGTICSFSLTGDPNLLLHAHMGIPNTSLFCLETPISSLCPVQDPKSLSSP